MSTVLVFNNGSKATLADALTLFVNAQGDWVEFAGAPRFVTAIESNLLPGDSFALTLVRASTAMPSLNYSIAGSGAQGQSTGNGNFVITAPRPTSAQNLVITAVPPTPAPRPIGLTVKPRSVPLSLATPQPTSFLA